MTREPTASEQRSEEQPRNGTSAEASIRHREPATEERARSGASEAAGRGEQRLVRPAAISGFPEWLPEVRLVELRWLDQIRTAFERYGFCSIETPAVEALEVLMAKGETSHEVYALRRLQAEPGDDSGRLGLHFDLTVPFARYDGEAAVRVRPDRTLLLATGRGVRERAVPL